MKADVAGRRVQKRGSTGRVLRNADRAGRPKKAKILVLYRAEARRSAAKGKFSGLASTLGRTFPGRGPSGGTRLCYASQQRDCAGISPDFHFASCEGRNLLLLLL